MKLLMMMVLCLTTFGPLQAEIRWNNEIHWNKTFTEKYRSEADGANVSFGVRTPPEVEGIEAYPLIVVLKGGLRAPPSEKFPYFRAQPSRGGTWGYRTISAYDALQVIAFMKQNYPIDANRIYLVGSSAGGSGAMHLASCVPDEFAAVIPLVGVGNNYPLRSFSNLPVAFHHGDRDWVSSICNARVQAQRMQALGCPTILAEYPTGHSVPGSHEPLLSWLFEQRRNPAPKNIRHDCEAPSLGRSYWLRIREFDDPHQRAYVDAEITDGVATIHPQNVAVLSLALDLIVDVKSVQIGQSKLPASNHYRFHDSRWQVAAEPVKPAVRAYEAGCATNLYQGESLLIVYGTGGDYTDQLRAAAEKLAAFGGPAHTAMRSHRFPVVADTALTDEQQARCNLILIGKPEENGVTGSLWNRLPASIKDNDLVVTDRTPLNLKNRVLGLLHPNPSHPDRLVYVLAPFTDKAGLQRFNKRPQFFLTGSEGFDRVSQPDLIVQDLDFRVARHMQFGKDWQWLNLPGADTPIPPGFADRSKLTTACMNLMLSKSGADFALWWGPADKGMWGVDFNHLLRLDSRSYTLADFRTRHRICETTLGSVTGAELKEIWTRWGHNQELLSAPEIALNDLDDKTEYRLHIPMDLYIKLGQRKKNLGNPKPGPTFTSEELIPRVFERE